MEKEQSFHHTVLGDLAILVQKKEAGGLLYTTDPDELKMDHRSRHEGENSRSLRRTHGGKHL